MKKINFKYLVVASFLLLLSILAKESGILIIFLVVFFSLFIKRRALFQTILIVIAPLITYLYMRAVIAHVFYVKANYIPIALAPIINRMMSIPKIVFYYLSTFLFPYNLSVSQHWIVRTLSAADFYLPLLFDLLFMAICIVSLVYIYYRKQKMFKFTLFFFVWFLAGICMYLQIIPIDMTVADRWFYLPMVGLLGFFGVLATSINIKSTRTKRILLTVSILILIALSMRSIIRTRNWADAYQLFSHDIQLNHNSFEVELNYAYQITKFGRMDESLYHAKKAVSLSPNSTAAWAAAGYVYYLKGNYHQSLSNYLEAVELDRGNDAAYSGVILSYLQLNNFKAAEEWTLIALKLFPQDKFYISFQKEIKDILNKDIKP